MFKNHEGVFEIILPRNTIKHGSKVKITLQLNDGSWVDRIPAYIKRSVQDVEKSAAFEGVYWCPSPYEFKHARPGRPISLKIYEAHGNIL